MKTENILLVLGIVIGLVVVVNGGLILSMLRGRGRNQYRQIIEGLQVLRNPWAQQDQQLEELGDRVAELQGSEPEDQTIDE
jgi:hypothetical protein